uniref:Secreted protein n=1 Tax=Panagrellus redivivus TaxID=6233 RepID=A0A7E4VBQ1_PANRE
MLVLLRLQLATLEAGFFEHFTLCSFFNAFTGFDVSRREIPFTVGLLFGFLDQKDLEMAFFGFAKDDAADNVGDVVDDSDPFAF